MQTFILRDLLKIKNGRDHKHLSDGGIPVYGSGGLMRYVNQAIYNKESILLPRKGTLRNIQYTDRPFWSVDTLYYTDINKDLCNPYFLYNYLINLDLSNLNSGTGVPSMTFESYYNLQIKLPSLEIQNQVAGLIALLSNKIHLNNQINDNLEQMAKAIYDYWFVQFDFPNHVGTPYKSSGGEMVYNDVLKKEIPKGWEVKSLFDICDVQYGYPFSTSRFNEEQIGKPVIRIRDILENSISTYSSQDNIDEKYRLLEGDLLVGMDGNFHLNFWSKVDCYLNQRVVRIRKKAGLLANFITLYQIEPFIKLREQSVSRTTVGHLSDKDLKSIKMLLPIKSLREKCNVFDDLLFKTVSNKKQNQELAALRDWLLPMLMNGQVTVK